MASNNGLGSNTKSAAHLLEILAWVLLFIVGTVIASVLVVNFMGKETEKATMDFWLSIGGVTFICFALIATAKALKKHLHWARYLGVFLAISALIAFPVGTVLGLFILSYLHKGWHEDEFQL